MFEKWLSSWKAQIVLGFGNILLIKIKIKCSTGQNLEIITFIFLKTLVFDKVFKNYNIIGCFYFWKVLLVITSLLLMIICFYPPIYLSLHSVQEDWDDHKKFWRFHQILSSHSSWGDDARWVPVIQGLSFYSNKWFWFKT